MSTTPQGGLGPDWPDQQPRRIVIFPFIALACIGVLAAANIYLFLELQSVRAEINGRLQAQNNQIAKMEASVTSASKLVSSKVKELRGAAETAQAKIAQTATQLQQQTLSKAQQVAQDMAQKLEVKHNDAITRVGEEVRELKQVASNTDSRVGSLAGEVSAVKSEVSSARSELENTIAALKSVRGDLGVQSGLIATNAKELQALRELGERNYYEFDVTKTSQPRPVGDVRIKLKKVDVKRNRFSFELWVDDKKIEKKDKTLNEPIQFFTANLRTPYELVVNQIYKDRLVGYLSAPKVPQRK